MWSVDILPQLTQWDSSHCTVRLCFNGAAGWPSLTLLHSGRCPAHIACLLSGGDAQLGHLHLFDVDSRVRIPVQSGMAAFTSPIFLPPQALHPVKVKVLHTDDGTLAHKLVCQLEAPVHIDKIWRPRRESNPQLPA